VNEYRWVNPHQPQTLYMGVILCYIQAVLSILYLSILNPVVLLVTAGLAAGAFGIANEKKWGYALAVAAAAFQVAVFLAFGGLHTLGNVFVLMSFAFDVLLVVLLLHPMSRDYQRIWFR
jgi:predicted lysophospholipase L1 biosynthesis ABC-type transport system permease subunit